jgi:hypothetical protein
MKFTVNLQQEIVKRTQYLYRDFLLYNLVSSYNSSKLDPKKALAKESTLAACAAWQY